MGKLRWKWWKEEPVIEGAPLDAEQAAFYTSEAKDRLVDNAQLGPIFNAIREKASEGRSTLCCDLTVGQKIRLEQLGFEVRYVGWDDDWCVSWGYKL